MTSTRIRRAAAAATLLTLMLATTGCQKFKARMTVREGNELFKAEKYEKAIAVYQKALAEDPELTKLYRNIGLAYMAMFQPASQAQKDKDIADKAIEYLKKYVDAYPTDQKGPEYLVTIYVNAARYDDAVSFFQAAIAKNPKDVETIRRLALVYQKKQDFDNALKWRLEQARLVETKDEKAEAWYTIGVICWDRSYNYPNLEPAYRQEVIQKGLDALFESIKHRENYFEAVAYINLIYREKAKYETDPAKKAAFMAEAAKYMQQALEMRKERAKTLAAKAATPALPTVPAEPATPATPSSAATAASAASAASTAAAPATVAPAKKK
jgi:tetratricopeptide (TPR) repeat protein